MQHTTDDVIRANKVRRSQRYMVVAMVTVLIVIGLLYLYMQQVATQRATQHKHSFMEYVTTHHVGTLTTIDSGTGLDPMSYVLTLDHTLADSEKESFALDMSYRYYEYDKGQSLTIVYVNPKTHQQFPIAETQYNRFEEKLSISITNQAGQTHQVTQQVNW